MQDDDVQVEPESGEIESDTDGERVEDRPEAKLVKLRAELSSCRKEKQEYMNGWQRAKADYVNALKRFDAESKAAESRGTVRAVETLLPAFDALERAKEHLPADRQAVNAEGFMAIAKQLESAFASLGLESVGIVGEIFDPSLHEALGQDPVDTAEKDHTITVVFETGWRVNGTVIRPAKVRIGQYTN